MKNNSEIEKLEKQFFQAMVDKDTKTAMDLCAEKSIVSCPESVDLVSRKDMAKMMEEGNWTLHSFKFSDVAVTFPTDEIAVIGYKVKQEMTVEDKPRTLEAYDTSTWILKDDKWLCVQHSETPLKAAA